MTGTFLSSEQRAAFDREGVLRLPQFVSPPALEAARAVVLKPLSELGLWRDGAWRVDALPRPKWPAKGLKAPKAIGNRHAELAALFEEPAARALVDELLEGRDHDRTIYRRPNVLITLPNADAWFVPNQWHADGMRLKSGESPGVQLFVMLDDVAPGGGGTMAVAGSHRLLNDGRNLKTAQIRDELVREPFFRDLYADERAPGRAELLDRRGRVGDVEVALVEMTGAAGDVWVIDLRVLHSAAPNAAATPRLMVTNRFVRADVVAEYAAAYGWEAEDT